MNHYSIAFFDRNNWKYNDIPLTYLHHILINRKERLYMSCAGHSFYTLIFYIPILMMCQIKCMNETRFELDNKSNE